MPNLMTPFRFRDIAQDTTLIVNEVGDFSFFDAGVVEKLFKGTLSAEEQKRFQDLFVLLGGENDWRLTALASRARNRIQKKSGKLSYMLIIPTLRCDLACSYCQVSRAAENAKGYDLQPEHLDLLEAFWAEHAGPRMKIEFQGGEPTLRADLVREIMDRATRHFDHVEFAICTNLMNLTPEAEEVISDPRMHVSTSIDGPTTMMAANRTGSSKKAEAFFQNLAHVMGTYGNEKVSALPTIPETAYDHIDEIIDVYVNLGFTSIFLRPVNYLGFARKNHASSLDSTERWNQAYFCALEKIMEINKTQFFEEYYASMLFQRLLVPEPLTMSIFDLQTNTSTIIA